MLTKLAITTITMQLICMQPHFSQNCEIWPWVGTGLTGLLCLFFHLLCYAAVLKILTYYSQCYAQEYELYYHNLHTNLLE